MTQAAIEVVERVASPLIVTVHGKPITQGSKTRTHWGMRDDNADTLKPWRASVTSAAVDAIAAEGRERLLGPVAVSIRFYFERPKSHYGTGRNAGIVKDSAPRFPMSQGKDGDIDKLVRAVLDSLKDAGVYRDDVQVVRLGDVEKAWAGSPDGLAIPGMVLEVSAL